MKNVDEQKHVIANTEVGFDGRSYFYNSITRKMNEVFFDEIRNGGFNEVNAMLTKNPVLLDSKDARGSTPLIMATYYDEPEITDLLLRHGAKTDAKDAAGNTALMGVCFKGYEDIAAKLIQKGADVNASNTMGATCLIYAVNFNRPAIARLLLENGVDTKARDNRGNTAMDHAKIQGSAELIALLEKS